MGRLRHEKPLRRKRKAFCAAYHLKSDNQQDAIDLLKKAQVKGYVFESVNGWTTFVTEAHEYKPTPAVTTHNKGLLLHFDRTSDFLCWGFHIYQNQIQAGKYSILSDDGETLKIIDQVDTASLSLLVDPPQVEVLQNLLHPETIDTAYRHGDYEFAQLVGLTHIEWVSYSFITRHIEDYAVLIVN